MYITKQANFAHFWGGNSLDSGQPFAISWCFVLSREIQFSPFLDCYAKPIIEAMLAAKSEWTLGQAHMDKKSYEDKNEK